MSNVDKFFETYGGKRLLEKHSLNDVGVWLVKGEDPNCDWGGHHHNPSLGYLSGKLSEVVTEAVEMSGFWTWGAGGEITAVNIRLADPSSAQRRKELLIHIEELEQKILDAKSKLEKL